MINTLDLMKTNFFADYASLRNSVFTSPLFSNTKGSVVVSLELNPYIPSNEKNKYLNNLLFRHNLKMKKIEDIKFDKITKIGSVKIQITHLPTAFNFTTKIIAKV